MASADGDRAKARLANAGRWLRGIEQEPLALAIACIGGACFVYSRATLPPLWPCVLALGVCLVGRWPGRGLIALFVITVAWSSGWAQNQLDGRWPAARHGEVVWLDGHVTGLPSHDTYRTRFELRRDRPPYRVRLSWYESAPTLTPGQCISVQAKLDAPHGSANPGAFDYESWLWRQGIDATGYVKRQRSCDAPVEGAWVDRARAAAARRVAVMLDAAPMTGIIQALTLGVRDHISNDQWQVLRATGTSHLVAISGLHIGLIAGLVFFAMRWLSLRLPGHRGGQGAAVAAALVCAFGYALLAGFALPTQRALVMVSIALLAGLSMRRVSALRMLALAAIAVVFWQPSAVTAPGFWLSFGAVGWLIHLSRLVRHHSRLAALVILQLGLVAGLMPVTLWLFGQASLVAPVVNAVLIPLAVVLVPLLLGAVLLALIWPAVGAPLLRAIAAGMEFGWHGLARVADWSWAAIHLAIPGAFALGLALAGLALLTLPRGIPGRWLAVWFLLPALFGWRPAGQAIEPGGYRLTVLDVGQGLATVVRTRAHTLVFDTGPSYRTGFNAGDAFVVPYLRQVGRDRIDRLIVSHADNDHIGGAEAIMAGLEVSQRWGAIGRDCHAGESWTWDGVEFAFLYPPAGQDVSAPRNERSCVLRIGGPGGSVLLTGDIEAPAERALVSTEPGRIKVDVLLVAHHGSATSTSPAFVAAVAPSYALISAGWHNRWGFPAAAVVDRLRRQDARLADTATGGALSVRVGAERGRITVSRWRRQHRRFWQVP
ncbi:DNA internalization-related competence protein ComEC/Rec2 [Salinisphaera sp. T31B1]|uniref:DNA internalization-related competence protein ComEC/Rec2 n=1 Tax=Salinisphaera sp. T31B1 TaxID=727963 RepID=UPI00333E7F8C